MLDLGTGTERGFDDLLKAAKGFRQAKRTAFAMREMRGAELRRRPILDKARSPLIYAFCHCVYVYLNALNLFPSLAINGRLQKGIYGTSSERVYKNKKLV